MELRRIGSAAIRSGTRDLPLSHSLQSNRQTINRTPIAYRSLSTTSRACALNPEPTVRAPVTAESSPSSSSSSPSISNSEISNASPATPPTPKEDTLESLGIGSINEALSFIKPDHRIAPSHFKSSSAQLENHADSPNAGRSHDFKSISLLQQLSSSSIRNPSSKVGNAYRPMQSSGSFGVESPWARMQIPKTDTSASDITKETNEFFNQSQPSTQRALMKFSARTGRTVDVNSIVDLSQGIRMLEVSCSQNKVRADANNQRFHERGGLKRKRLRRQRWRVNFMEGFKGIVGRVKQLKKQGW